jgi:DNA-binding CsgD family transcriptional regulator
MAYLDANASDLLRSEDIPDAVADALVSCRDVVRMRRSVAEVAASLGFDGFSYLLLGNPWSEPRLLLHWSTAGTAWTARYAARRYQLVDPRICLTLRRAVPVVWSATPDACEPRMEAFLDDALHHGIRSGVALSLYDASLGRAVLAWDSSDAGNAVPPVRHRLASLTLLAGFIHEAFAAQLRANARPPQAQKLTDRERECVALVARGMTSVDVGAKLGITTRTANFHIANVMAKLGAVSRAEAVARAMACDLVSL